MAMNWWAPTENPSTLWSKAISAQSEAAQDVKGVADGKLAAAKGTGDTAGLREVAEKKRAAAAYNQPTGFQTPTAEKWSK